MKLMTLQEVADKLRVHHRTVRRWVASGLIPVIRMTPRKLLFDVAEVERAVKRMAAKPAKREKVNA